MEKETVYYATGRRKSSIARTWLRPGKGTITVNEKPIDQYFDVPSAQFIINQPLHLVNAAESWDIQVRVLGGGLMGQAGAVRHGITRALMQADPSLRPVLKKAGFVRRDPRTKERKKYGQRAARARFQFSKR
ncbi:30S ribosomal protein S9 [Desulfatirhabdium butyrativorans]|jgi:small subunit ribosomal protein S9|uniref:30S ribosomal protein S9 n=1 Tax=Desulfatirhabdium butyrativorans TaxID=340467 RepID=UPI00040872B8|nr:30S ribosomal protein S9 [Desulfatirhabdium butyrativorans]